MCETHNPRKIDKCMIPLLHVLKHIEHLKVMGCCCGHSRYPKTVVMYNKWGDWNFELFSGKIIGRKRRYYKKDSKGYYYIPEISKPKR